ncbi:high-affnity carbon uptake protein Hat/HatR [Agrobacterium phage Atu_ph07]|uniref:High-affnity carbon uptake protein Hat/HatR n=1 Tax=Agrobacterium phage Atu_ph07 TaxID=2024264 RepID=A0A2L0V0K9_9CAUD|nr:high-affnity carbon uptake protein Hat/HatR [Agrobacterium phage Atu_ph07]AUZ95334.1 high-affnity carbon uptake protein Hat/HatR [Agrobacterium phage Atu_ph07]
MSIIIDNYKNVNIGFAYSMAKLSPNGRFIALSPNSGASITTQHIYDTVTETLLQISSPARVPTEAIAFSPNGNKLYVGCANNGTILVFEYTTSWAYVSSIVSSDNTATIHSIAVGADNIDIAWVEGLNVFKFYNTTTTTYYAGGGTLVATNTAVPFIYADTARKASDTNYFVFGRPTSGAGGTAYIIKQDSTYLLLQAQSNINISNVNMSGSGTVNYVSFNSSSSATAGIRYYNNDIMNSSAVLSISQNNVNGGSVVCQIDEATSLRYARVSPGLMSVGQIAGYNVIDPVNYTITSPFTISGDMQIFNKTVINYSNNNGTFLEYATIKNTDGNETITVNNDQASGLLNRYYAATNYVVSENGKKYLYTNINNTLQMGNVVNGVPINNNVGNPAGTTNNIIANNAAISPNGRHAFIVDATTLYHYTNSLNTALASRKFTYPVGSAGSRQMSVSPDSKLLAFPDGTSLKVYSISETGLTALTVPATNQVWATAWFSPTEFYGMTTSSVIFYRVSGSTVTQVGTMSVGTSLYSMAISNDRTKLAFTSFAAAGSPYFANINPSDFTQLGVIRRGNAPPGGFFSNNYYGSFSPDGNKFVLCGAISSATNNLIVYDTTEININTIYVLGNRSISYSFAYRPQWINNNIFKIAVNANTVSLHDFSVINGVLTEITNFNVTTDVNNSIGDNTWGTGISPDGKYIIRPVAAAKPDLIYLIAPDTDSFTDPLPFKSTITTSCTISSDSKYMMLPGPATNGNGTVDFYEKTSEGIPVPVQQFTGLPWVTALATSGTLGDYSPVSKMFAVPYGRTLLLFINNEDGTFTNISKYDLTANRLVARFSNDGSLLYVAGATSSTGVDIYDRVGNDYVYRTTIATTTGVTRIDFSPNGQYVLLSYNNAAPYLNVYSIAPDGTFDTLIASTPFNALSLGRWLTDTLLFVVVNNNGYGYYYVADFFADKGVIIPRNWNGTTLGGGMKQNISISNTGSKKLIVLGHATEIAFGSSTTTASLNNFTSLYAFKMVDTATNISGATVIPSITTEIISETDLALFGDVSINSITTTGEIEAPNAIYGDVLVPSPFSVDGFIGEDSSSAITTVTLSTAFIDLNGYNYELSYTPLPQPYAYGKTRFGSISTIGQLYIDNELYGDTLIPMFVVEGDMNLPPQFEGDVLINNIITEGDLYEEQFLSGETVIDSITSSGALSQGETIDIGILLPSFEISGEFLLEPEIYGDTLLPSFETDGLFTVPQNASGDVLIPSIVTEGRLSDGEDITGEVIIPSIETTGYVTSGENISGETLIPFIITSGELITDLAIDSDTIIGPISTSGILASGDFVTGDVNISNIITEIVGDVLNPGEITGDTLISNIITEGIMAQEGAITGDVVISNIITNGVLSRQIDVEGSIILNSIETEIVAELQLHLSGNVIINSFTTTGELKKIAGRRRFLNIV